MAKMAGGRGQPVDIAAMFFGKNSRRRNCGGSLACPGLGAKRTGLRLLNKNWADDDLRRLILNGIVWSAKLDVPSGGVATAKPDLAAFQPESVEPKPRPARPKKAAG